MNTQEQKSLIKSPEYDPFNLICLIQVIFALILGVVFAIPSYSKMIPTIKLVTIFLTYYTIVLCLDIIMISGSINEKVYIVYYLIEGILKLITYAVMFLFIFSRVPVKEVLINTINQSNLASGLFNFVVGFVLLFIPMWVAMGVAIKYKEKNVLKEEMTKHKEKSVLNEDTTKYKGKEELTKESFVKVYPNVATRIPRKYL
ncbi:hypothetical protein LCAUW4_0359 [Lacticaseibacillus casei UW4]|jgi:glucan phosphoethanolaminetransferase (alkaline phosphatase superfamily)|uniref:hypothetical protein n=2 Tax=Lacticaseibacillus paracasei TaxID=1597 RepID=UPI000297CD26|nr:hypothetical protein [Lacticaseibacillus paracasei]EKQ24208.1 hypothetical protein LCAUW4_0359 [Lacticaseibacillus casei UW4]OUC70984.1 hypothetical protein BLL69_0440c [Lacticaseibacillus paracasei]